MTRRSLQERYFSRVFADKGYELRKMPGTSTERFGTEGEEYKYYAYREGRIVAKFRSIGDAAQWIEFRRT